MYSPSIKNWKINLIIHDKKEFVHLDFLLVGSLRRFIDRIFTLK